MQHLRIPKAYIKIKEYAEKCNTMKYFCVHSDKEAKMRFVVLLFDKMIKDNNKK